MGGIDSHNPMDRNEDKERMRRISSKLTFFNKRVFPLICFGFLAFIVVTILFGHRGDRPPLPPILIVPVLLAALFYALFRKNLEFNLVDEVWDDGDALVVKNSAMEERVPLKNIINVGFSTTSQRVTLTLREAGCFGKEFTFIPPAHFALFARSLIIDELIERVDRARG
jgi:hypothetical protein